ACCCSAAQMPRSASSLMDRSGFMDWLVVPGWYELAASRPHIDDLQQRDHDRAEDCEHYGRPENCREDGHCEGDTPAATRTGDCCSRNRMSAIRAGNQLSQCFKFAAATRASHIARRYWRRTTRATRDKFFVRWCVHLFTFSCRHSNLVYSNNRRLLGSALREEVVAW